MKAVTITCDCRCECHNPAIGTTIAPMLCGSTIESWGGDCRNACRAGWRCNDERLALNLQIKTQHIQPGWHMAEPEDPRLLARYPEMEAWSDGTGEEDT